MRFYPKQPKRSKLILKILIPVLILLGVFSYLNSAILYRSIVEVNMQSSYTSFLDAKFQFVEFFSKRSDSFPKRKDMVVKMSPNNYVLFQKERAKKTKYYILNGAIIADKAIDSIENTYYKAKVKVGGANSAAKLKLFGLYPDQFGDSDGHSFRLKFNGATGFGKKKVNVLKPIRRSFNSDRMINILFKKGFKGIAIKSEPVNVIFNKKNYGIYLVEDFLDKYLIEENFNRESLIFEIKNNKPHFNHIPKNEDAVEQIETINKLVSEEGFKGFLNLIDEEKIFGFMAFTLIMNNNHSSLDINLHWYYNSLTNTFEPTIRETKIREIQKEVSESEFREELKAVLGKRNSVLTTWMSSMSAKKFNKGISKALTEIEHQFNNLNKDLEYLKFKGKLLGFGSVMSKNETLFYENLQKLKRKKIVDVDGNIDVEVIRITKDTVLNSDLVISKSKSLMIDAGVVVTLTNNADILIKSGKLTVNGTGENEVVFLTDKKSESSIFIHTKEYTQISYTTFKNLSALNKGIWKLPSAVTLFESNAMFSNCKFLDNLQGDDMINIFACEKVLFSDCIFSNIKSDAIDSDFSKSKIMGCKFEKIGNDAIDGSGSVLSIQNNTFNNVEDKVISAGEESNFLVVSNIIKNSELGLVSKDGSHLLSKNNQLIDNTIDLVLFKKKPIYAFPSLELIKTEINSNLIEKGCEFKGVVTPIFAKNINKKLYGNTYGKATE